MRKLTYCYWILILFTLQASAQKPTSSSKITREITGKIINDKGEPLVNVNVVIKRTGKGTATSSNGNFTLRGIDDEDILHITHIGYTPQNVPVKNKDRFFLTLEPAKNELDKVVVQAYGTTSKRLATGNITTVTAEEISKHPVMNPVQILQGLVPGAVVTNSSGVASSSVKIEIRGRNTIDPLMVSEPLYIVDGVPMTILNVSSSAIQASVAGSAISMGTIQSGITGPGIGESPFFNINPSDIESIEVLKDADATAIYGSRAANGVILITTKKGSVGKTQVEISAFTGFSDITRFYTLLNTQQYVSMRKEALKNDGLPIDLQTAPDLMAWDTTRYTDWQKYMYGGIGKRTSIQTNLSGGDIRNNFRASAGYDYDKGISTERGGSYRGSFSLNLNHKSPDQRFGFSWSFLYSLSKIDVTERSGSVLSPPNAPTVFDDNGHLNYAGWEPISSYFSFEGLLSRYTSNTKFLNSNIGLSYELFKGLTINTNIGYNNSQNEQIKIIPIAAQNPLFNPRGSYELGHSTFHNLIIEPKAEYTSFISKGRLTVLIGATAQTNKTGALRVWGTNYPDDLLLNSINNAPNKTVSHYYGEYKYAGAFTRITYNWQNKYILNLNGRRDGSSRFGPGRQFGNFGSAGGAWIFSEEPGIKGSSAISFGKLRVSYGITGSDQITDYLYLSRWMVGNLLTAIGTYNSRLPISPVALSDSLLQWEVNKKLEASINIGLFNQRISFDASWYKNRCNNQLVAFPTPGFTGFISVTSNTPANVQNTGWEFMLTGKIIDTKETKWINKLSVSINRNKLLSYPNFSQSPYRWSLKIGLPLDIARVLKVSGVDPQAGEYTFEDINHDGAISIDPLGVDDDLYPIILTPKFDGGFSTSLTYKNLALSVLFYFRKQFGTSINAYSNPPGVVSNQSSYVLDRWQHPGDIAPVAKYTTFSSTSLNNYYNYSDARITDASFIRLQNLSLSYELPEKMKSKIKLKEFKLFVQVENLFIISGYDGIDPEVQTLGVPPRPRIATIGVSANF